MKDRIFFIETENEYATVEFSYKIDMASFSLPRQMSKLMNFLGKYRASFMSRLKEIVGANAILSSEPRSYFSGSLRFNK